MTATATERTPVADDAQRQSRSAPRVTGFAPALGICVLVAIVVARSWLSDDAFITLRTVDNLVHGYGPRWNIADRVQTYTHPLWMLLLAVPYAFTREPYFTTLAMNWSLTVVAASILAYRLAASPVAGAWAGLALALSGAFSDYSTSGLENSLTHAALAWFLLRVRREEPLGVMLASSAIVLSRPDAFLLIAPALAVYVWPLRPPKAWRAVVLGCSPMLLWAAWALAYYGFVWPNTAYAKLGSGIPLGELAEQGVRYLVDSLRRDPLMLSLTITATLLTVRRASALDRALALGMLLYLAWVVRLGGDFMSGRFLTAPFFVAVALIAKLDLGPQPMRSATVALSVLVGVSAPHASWRGAVPGTRESEPIVDHGIADERSFYLGATGLAARIETGPDFDHPARREASKLRESGRQALVRLTTLGCGIFGYYAGPKIHIVDEWALTDALLARLPAARQLHWRIGHFVRIAPPGYMKTLASGRNQIRDPELARYWDQLSLIVRGPVFSVARWRAIASFATGHADREIDRERYRLADLVIANAATIDAAAGAVRFGDGGLDVRWPANVRSDYVALAVEGGEAFALSWYRGPNAVASSEVHGGTVNAAVPAAARSGFDRLRVLALRGSSSYRLTRCESARAQSHPDTQAAGAAAAR